VLDAVIMGDDEQSVAANAPYALRMADGVIRVGVTGPDGWVHERPAPGGGYAVMDPDSQALEP
jgi:hypothetical protein